MNRKLTFSIIFLTIILILAATIMHKGFGAKNNYETNLKISKEANMKITSVFEHNTNIPSIYTCDGDDLAPELTITEVPDGTKELVLIVDDPDAPIGTFVHWVLYNIPPTTTKIDNRNLPKGAKQGHTDFGRNSWGGPCPPSGVHRYFFKLYAIDKTLEFKEGVKKRQIENEIEEHIIEKAELIGLYKRN